MTTTPDTIATADEPRRPSGRVRFLVAFLVGLLAAMALGVGALYAYDQQYVGRVLPGVTIGSVDLSGMDAGAASSALGGVYGSASDGAVVLTGPDGEIVIPFASFGRRADIDTMVTEALAVGRDDHPIGRAVGHARTALRGVVLEARITFDADALAERIAAELADLARPPVNASVAPVADGTFILSPSRDGRRADAAEPTALALAAAGALDAPARIRIDVPVTTIEPTITTAEAEAARTMAERITTKITLAADVDKPPSISTKQLVAWTRFAQTPDGGYAPTLDMAELPAVLEKLAKKIDRAPLNASFKTSGGKISGVTPSKNGHTVDIDATVARVGTLIAERATGGVELAIEPALTVTKPALTTAEAEAARPKMTRISRWTTYFPVSEKNGNGANIWIPARLIDGYVVAPGATFDFWDAIGPVTRAKGYKDGGAIIDGKTEPQGALAGGICSCSTTLFNAALRAGYEMGARRNHYYYIDRYPLGLDATVFISASGSTQTMSFTNDTKYPLLIRGRGWKSGGSGYVRFDLYSVPTGRKVSIQTGSRQDIRRATDTVQSTSSLAPGARKRIEYPVDGFKVTAVRTVRDREGNVIHKDTYFSSYARITGITLVGKGTPAPKPTPTSPPASDPLPTD
jgi:vancomycin resistance protein YoaR